MKVVRLSAVRSGHLYPSESFPGTRFWYRLSRPLCHSAAGRIMSTKYSHDTVGNRTFRLVAQCLCQLRHAVPRLTQTVRAIRSTSRYLKFCVDLTGLIDNSCGLSNTGRQEPVVFLGSFSLFTGLEGLLRIR
jgi:hypothetical protein